MESRTRLLKKGDHKCSESEFYELEKIAESKTIFFDRNKLCCKLRKDQTQKYRYLTTNA